MFFEEGVSPSYGNENVTFVTRTAFVTTTSYETATRTATISFTETVTRTVIASPTPRSTLSITDIPHHPKADTAFGVIFGVICISLITGIIVRKKSKKLKGFNLSLILGTFFNSLGHILHANHDFIAEKYELGRVIHIILTLAPIFYSLGLFLLHRKTRNRETVRSAMMFSILSGIQPLYCLIASFGDGAVLFYSETKWGEMDVARQLAVSQVVGQQMILCVMMGMWLRGRNVPQDHTRSYTLEEILALVSIPTILGTLLARVCTQFIMIIRNDQCFVAYDLLDRSVEIHFAGAAAMSMASLVCVVCQAWLWRQERINCKITMKRREDEERQTHMESTWTASPQEKLSERRIIIAD